MSGKQGHFCLKSLILDDARNRGPILLDQSVEAIAGHDARNRRKSRDHLSDRVCNLTGDAASDKNNDCQIPDCGENCGLRVPVVSSGCRLVVLKVGGRRAW